MQVHLQNNAAIVWSKQLGRNNILVRMEFLFNQTRCLIHCRSCPPSILFPNPSEVFVHTHVSASSIHVCSVRQTHYDACSEHKDIWLVIPSGTQNPLKRSLVPRTRTFKQRRLQQKRVPEFWTREKIKLGELQPLTIEDRFYTDLDGNNYSLRLPKKNEQNMIELSASEKR